MEKIGRKNRQIMYVITGRPKYLDNKAKNHHCTPIGQPNNSLYFYPLLILLLPFSRVGDEEEGCCSHARFSFFLFLLRNFSSFLFFSGKTADLVPHEPAQHRKHG